MVDRSQMNAAICRAHIQLVRVWRCTHGRVLSGVVVVGVGVIGSAANAQGRAVVNFTVSADLIHQEVPENVDGSASWSPAVRLDFGTDLAPWFSIGGFAMFPGETAFSYGESYGGLSLVQATHRDVMFGATVSLRLPTTSRRVAIEPMGGFGFTHESVERTAASCVALSPPTSCGTSSPLPDSSQIVGMIYGGILVPIKVSRSVAVGPTLKIYNVFRNGPLVPEDVHGVGPMGSFSISVGGFVRWMLVSP